MKKIKLVLLTGICIATNAFAQQFDLNCNIDIDRNRYALIDSLEPVVDIIDEGKAGKYLYSKNGNRRYLLVTNKEEYKLFKTRYAKDIDFDQYNVFAAYFPNHAEYRVESYSFITPPIKFSLLFGVWDNWRFTSIVQFRPTPELRSLLPPLFITVIIPKKYCEKICYTEKRIPVNNTLPDNDIWEY